jgi:hypothetical protein
MIAIRAAIITAITAVPEIGRVHDRERYAAQQNPMRELYLWTGPGGAEIRGWFVRRAQWRSISSALARRIVDTKWTIRGLLGIQDTTASELVMDSLCEAVRLALEADTSLGGLVDGFIPALGAGDFSGGVNLDETGPAMLANQWLCHSASLSFYTRHRE